MVLTVMSLERLVIAVQQRYYVHALLNKSLDFQPLTGGVAGTMPLCGVR
jgi:hypothetical protein